MNSVGSVKTVTLLGSVATPMEWWRETPISGIDSCPHATGDGVHEPTLTARNLVNKALDETQRTHCMSYGASHATISSGRVRLATDGGAKIAR